jgi:chromosome segregation ATPase
VEIPIGATKEYLKSILGGGKYLVILKSKYDGKFLTSKVLEFEDENVLNKGGKMLYQDDTNKTFLEREYQNLKIEVEALRKEKERLTEELLTLKTENMKLASERDNAIRNMSIANADMENKNKKIKELEEELKNAQKELKELEKKLDDAKQAIRDYETDKKITAREIQELKEDINELKTEKTRLETELSNARSMKEIMSLIKKDDKSDIISVLLTSLITHNTEKAKGEIELKKEQLNALKELKLAEIETGLRSAIEEEMPEEEEKTEENEKKKV